MSSDLHRQAEVLMERGDELAAAGQRDEARSAYRQAALREAEAVDLIPLDRPRTRGIVAVSAVALFRKAAAFQEAVFYAHRFLGADGIPDFAQGELDDLLETSRSEHQALLAGKRISADAMEWIFRGPAIGDGAAPIAVVVQKLDQIQKFARRVYEYIVGAPVRVSGPADPKVTEGFDMLVSEPARGSMRFGIRFAAPLQLPLFPDSSAPSPDELAETASAILDGIQEPASDKLRHVVRDGQYRRVFVTLGRTLLPDGKAISQVEVLCFGDGASPRVILTPGLRGALTQELANLTPRPSAQPIEITDVLRVVDLNRGWIKLGQKGQETTCYVGGALVLEDVVGPLVNQTVHVICRTGQRGRLEIQDIEPDESESTSEDTSAAG